MQYFYYIQSVSLGNLPVLDWKKVNKHLRLEIKKSISTPLALERFIMRVYLTENFKLKKLTKIKNRHPRIFHLLFQNKF